MLLSIALFLGESEMSEEWFPSKAEKFTLRGLTRFDECLLEVINDVLVQVLGETAAEFIVEFAVFKTLKRDETRISFEEDAKTFVNTLQGILGTGSMPIEKMIIEQLYSKLNIEFKEKSNYTFSDYIKELKKRVEKRD